MNKARRHARPSLGLHGTEARASPRQAVPRNVVQSGGRKDCQSVASPENPDGQVAEVSTEPVDSWIEDILRVVALPAGGALACPYLPGRQSCNCAFAADSVPPELYHKLMNRGFRRSGHVFYRPECDGCRECTPVRVPVASFRPSRSQRRVWRRNADVRVSVGEPRRSKDKWRLYVRYLRHQHDGSMSEAFGDFGSFLYCSPVDTLEFCYYLDDRLIGVGLADVCSRSVSTVYFYFAPECSKRGLGTYSVLWEIEYCRRQGIPYYYLGFYVRDTPRMSYKIRFRPCELLGADGVWRVVQPGDPPRSTELPAGLLGD